MEKDKKKNVRKNEGERGGGGRETRLYE